MIYYIIIFMIAKEKSLIISELKKTPLGVNLNHIFLLCVPINQDNLRKYHHMFYQNYVCTMDRQYHEDYL